MAAQVPTGVGWTSLITAYARAQESRRPDRLFDDPWAELLVGAAAGSASPTASVGGLPRVGPARDDQSSSLWTTLQAHFLARTSFFDHHVELGVAAGAEQLVLLAAGLDARAARLELPAGMRVFEVDTAAVLEFKRAVLSERGLDTVRQRTLVVADMRGGWDAALLAAGFRADVPTLWLAEGLLVYLDAAQAEAVLATVHRLSAPSSRIVVDYFGRAQRREDFPDADPGDQQVIDLLFSAIAAGPPVGPAQWLPDNGITPVEVTDTASRLRALARPVPVPVDAAVGQEPVAWLAAGRF